MPRFMADIRAGITSLRNSRLALILRSIARRGLTVIFRSKEAILGYKREKSDCEM